MLSVDDQSDKSGYIIQGSIDSARCLVPDDLRAVRPFRNSSPVERQKPIAEEGSIGEVQSEAITPPDAIRDRRLLRWRLSCWSIDEIKLEFDRTKELQFEAIQAAWVEASRDRDTHPAASRLLYLQNHEAADSLMREEGVAEEQAIKVKGRYEWLSQACENAKAVGPFLELRNQENIDADEVVRTPTDLERDAQMLTGAIEETQKCLAVREEARAMARKERADELQSFVASFKDRRLAAWKTRQMLYAERDEALRFPVV
ncbi:hypothetical protein PINS_up003142 [Pythium insidiosum]|nr:hypothetical protein PINS_up003142 [Pythium insidiosum]